MRYVRLIALASLLLLFAGPASAQVKSAACPAGTLLFGYGGSYGCVKPGTNEVVAKCIRQRKCPSGWKGAGMVDEKGHDVCCLAQKTKAPWRCVWRGTAPICDGGCKAGEVFYGAAKSPSDYIARDFPGFGASCQVGQKHYCCNRKWEPGD